MVCYGEARLSFSPCRSLGTWMSTSSSSSGCRSWLSSTCWWVMIATADVLVTPTNAHMFHFVPNLRSILSSTSLTRCPPWRNRGSKRWRLSFSPRSPRTISLSDCGWKLFSCTHFACVCVCVCVLQELEKMRGAIRDKDLELSAIRKENRKRKRTIRAYQGMVNIPTSDLHAVSCAYFENYHVFDCFEPSLFVQCAVCKRTFLCEHCLLQHMQRRHPDHPSLRRPTPPKLVETHQACIWPSLPWLCPEEGYYSQNIDKLWLLLTVILGNYL